MRFFVHVLDVLVPTEKQKWKMMVLRYLGSDLGSFYRLCGP